MTEKIINNRLMNFIQQSPTPFHATANVANTLEKAGHIKLDESQTWDLKPGGSYYLTRNDSSIIAFTLAKGDIISKGFRMLGAHTDSPALKVKPQPEKKFKNYFQLGVEIYGGVLLAPWFDRDLSLAGRISYLSKEGRIESKLIDFERAIATVPSLAIHLNRNANENRTINKQKEMPPVLFQLSADDKEMSFNDILMQELSEQKLDSDVKNILEHELFFYDVQPPAYVGLKKDFIAAARHDNLLSCAIGLESYLASNSPVSKLIVFNDHEEVGSCSHAGADGPMLRSTFERIFGNHEDTVRTLDNSLMISCDNAHGVHPNYSDKHDENHGPILNSGPVIKINSNQRYASNSDTVAVFIHACEKAGVPYQKFVTRADMGCGSTIGPITSANIGVKTLDIGVPTFGMHSIRELAGSKDSLYLTKALKAFLDEDKAY